MKYCKDVGLGKKGRKHQVRKLSESEEEQQLETFKGRQAEIQPIRIAENTAKKTKEQEKLEKEARDAENERQHQQLREKQKQEKRDLDRKLAAESRASQREIQERQDKLVQQGIERWNQMMLQFTWQEIQRYEGDIHDLVETHGRETVTKKMFMEHLINRYGMDVASLDKPLTTLFCNVISTINNAGYVATDILIRQNSETSTSGMESTTDEGLPPSVSTSSSAEETRMEITSKLNPNGDV